VLKFPDDRRTEGFSTQTTNPRGSSGVGGGIHEQRDAADCSTQEERKERDYCCHESWPPSAASDGGRIQPPEPDDLGLRVTGMQVRGPIRMKSFAMTSSIFPPTLNS
jgi:hypothetical protein